MNSTTIRFHSVPIDLTIGAPTTRREIRSEIGLGTSLRHDHAEAAGDGRRIRRVRNRDRVIEEFIDLARSTGEAPDTERLAEASRISVRSIYRYFTSHEALLTAVAERVAEHAAAQFGPGDSVDDDPRHRISTIVSSNLRFHHWFGPALGLASTPQRTGDAIDDALHRIDQSRRRQIETLLETELAHDEHRDDTLAIIEIGLSDVALARLAATFPGQTTKIHHLLERHVATHLRLPDRIAVD